LQQFNKLVHRELGASPRTIRTTARSRSSAHQSAS
jgi:hypothetical protein